MLVAAIGIACILCAIYSIRYPKLLDAVKNNDQLTWRALFSNGHFKSFAIYQWIKGKGFERSNDKTIRRRGREAYQQVVKTHRMFVSGATMCFLGGVLYMVGFPF